MRGRTLAMVLVAALLTAGSGSADIPPPGTHSVKPKYWPASNRWVVNFSPFDFYRGVSDLAPDPNGGVWFGIGRTLEHIDARGQMYDYEISPEWLWVITSLAYDPRGRLWFSLGQSGRIGTLVNGQIRTAVLVPRKFFPDVEWMAFTRDGTLWFNDRGRSSVGRRARDGTVRETPIPGDQQLIGMTLCNERAFGFLRASTSLILNEYDSSLQKHTVFEIMSKTPGYIDGTLACDAEGALWLGTADWQGQQQSAAVRITADGKRHVYESALKDQKVIAAWDGTVWFAGFVALRNSACYPGTCERLALSRRATGRDLLVLPVSYDSFRGLIVDDKQDTYLAVYYPHSVVRLRSAKGGNLTAHRHR